MALRQRASRSQVQELERKVEMLERRVLDGIYDQGTGHGEDIDSLTEEIKAGEARIEQLEEELANAVGKCVAMGAELAEAKALLEAVA